MCASCQYTQAVTWLRYKKKIMLPKSNFIFVFLHCLPDYWETRYRIYLAYPETAVWPPYSKQLGLPMVCLMLAIAKPVTEWMVACSIAAKILDLGVYPMSTYSLRGFEVKGDCRSKTHPKLILLVIVLSGFVPLRILWNFAIFDCTVNE